MIYHVREFGYTENYAELFKDLIKMKEHIENTYPGVTSTPMYNLDGERGKVHILTSYSSMGEYEKVNDQMDKDETFTALQMEQIKNINLNVPIVDHFYRGIS
ncbi:MAG: hypothetical protein KAR21_02135 [Spirochaetales bacterium]|nr:hypothetical protein [Spirochaetales bacterium]